jgi:hypothetical protein
MIKLADDGFGSISSQQVDKALTDQERRGLDEGVVICKDILRRFGAAVHQQPFTLLLAQHLYHLHDRSDCGLRLVDFDIVPALLSNQLLTVG